jgi:hypothetical protein
MYVSRRAGARAKRAARNGSLGSSTRFRSATRSSVPLGVRRALAAGIGHEREWVRFWKAIKEGVDEP